MKTAARLQKFVRSRWARLGLAASLVALSAWAFFPHVGYRIASSAFVNAELVRIAAPIPGLLTRDLPRKGDIVERITTVTLIESRAQDQRHLLHLSTQHAVATERATLVRKQLVEIAAADEDLAQRVLMYRQGMVTRIEREIDETHAERNGCVAEAAERREIGTRMRELVNTGLATAVRTSEAQAALHATLTRCEMAAAKLERLQGELKSAHRGVFLRDGANDASYSKQQRDRLLLRRQELEIKAVEEELQAKQSAGELQAERERVERLSRFETTLPAHHVVWSVAATPGSTVSEGQTLIDLANCDRRFVSVELAERDFEKIKAGDIAFVRLIGGTDWKQSRIQQVRGSAARTDDRLLAAQVKRPDPHSITVEVELPEDDSKSINNSFCNIGRLAEVRFQRTGWALFDKVGRKLGALLAPGPSQLTEDRLASY